MSLLPLLLVFSILVSLFIITYILNNKTDKPDIEVDMSGCKGCHNIGCNHHNVHNKEA